MKHVMLIAVALLGVLAAPGIAAAQSGYVVIVNDGNPTHSVSREELSQIFLKRRTDFPSGLAAVPVDQQDGAAVREAFSQAVLGRPATAVVAFWQREIFSGRGVPPVQQRSDDEVIAYVRSTANAVGYVSRGASLGSGVHAVQIVGR